MSGSANGKTQFIVMGVSGCGKSSIAKELASRSNGVFLDADDFHPLSNKEKMAAGIPLTDEDRWTWLDALNRKLKSHAANGESVFLACSALRESYRERMAMGLPKLQFIYLKGSRELIRSRLMGRENHFMPPELLDSQFATLEEPKGAIVADIDKSVSEIVDTLSAMISRQ